MGHVGVAVHVGELGDRHVGVAEEAPRRLREGLVHQIAKSQPVIDEPALQGPGADPRQLGGEVEADRNGGCIRKAGGQSLA